MHKVFLIATVCFFSLIVSGNELQLTQYEEIFPFGSGLVGIKSERQNSPTATIRLINLHCEEVKRIQIYLGDGHRISDYAIMGSRLYFRSFDANDNGGGSEVYFYDTSLTLISKKFLPKQSFEKKTTRTGSTETRFDMVEYYDRETILYRNGLLSSDKFTDDGLLFLKFNEATMLTGIFKDRYDLELADQKSPVVIYKLKWGQDTGIFPVNFDVQWTVKLPFKSVKGYRFYTYGKSAVFLYLVSKDGGRMRSYFYKLNPENGAIIQMIEVKLANRNIPWVSSAHYDESSGKLFIAGNYQSNKTGKMFDGYFVQSIDEKGKANSILKPFPVLPKNEMPEKWSEAPMLIADHFVKGKDGKFTLVCSFCYSFDEPDRKCKIGESYGPGRAIATAAIVLLDFDESVSEINPRIFMFEHYDENTWKVFYGRHTVFQAMNRFLEWPEEIHPFVFDIPANGTAEMICPNTIEKIDTAKNEEQVSYYVLSTTAGSEMKKTFDFTYADGIQLLKFFPGIPGESICLYSSGEKGDYLEIVKTR